MAGRLIAVVRSSGAGKDTLIAAMAARRPALHPVRRVVTRPAAPRDEPFEPASAAEFARREDDGDFALSWRAHGLCYGIPRAELGGLAAGRDALVNLSRGVLGEGLALFPCLFALHVEAPAALRAERLAARGRESAADMAGRLWRKGPLPARLPVIRADNSATVAAAADAALDRHEALP